MDSVRIFDTTLRDGEQSPGFSMNTEEKIRMARQLAALGVDVIEIGFLCQVCQVAVDAGATILNLPDTVGYAVPDEYGAMFEQVRAHLDDPQGITLSAHCHDDLGLAVANSLAAVRAGVRQIECTINGIGERAGNAALEEIAVALAVRKESFGVTTGIRLEQLFPTIRMLTEITGAQVAPNKAIVGANAFAHEAGIHQDCIIKNPLTYEIRAPQAVGVPARSLVLRKHSGRHALRMTLRDLGYESSETELAEVYSRVTALSDQSKQVRPRDIVAIAHEVIRRRSAALAAEPAPATGPPLLP